MLCSLDRLPRDALHTAVFIEKMDMLFNCFNSSSITSTAKFRYALSEKSQHRIFLLETLEWLSTVKSLGSRQLPCISGWQMAISCVLELWEDLCNSGVSFLLTNRLNQDCLEKLFSVIRGKGGNRDNPDAVQFRMAFRQVMVDAIMVPSKGSNCQEDVDTFLLTLKNMGKPASHVGVSLMPPTGNSVNRTIPESVQSLLSVCTPPESCAGLSLEESNILVYISGFICRKTRKKICQNCQSGLLSRIDVTNPAHLFLASKNCAEAKEGLLVPSTSFGHTIELMETQYREVLESVIHMDRVRHRIVTALEKNLGTKCDVLACTQCGCRALVLNLFATVRLHHSLKEQTQLLASGKGRRNRKIMKFSRV